MATTVWPKTPPVLSDAQTQAREQYMMLWHQLLPKKYGVVERFNHGFPSRLPIKEGSKTLEIGAGLGAHSAYEDLSRQEYHCLEYRQEFCKELRKKTPPDRVRCGDIQERQSWEAETFDRVVAIHVLEHLPNLPAALAEISRVLKSDGVLDIVIPCEGGFAHSLGRKITAERLFRKHFKMDFTPIRKSEHVNTFVEIMEELRQSFRVQKRSYFPFLIPYHWLNFVAGFRLLKR